jgi:hypothetical protein
MERAYMPPAEPPPLEPTMAGYAPICVIRRPPHVRLSWVESRPSPKPE